MKRITTENLRKLLPKAVFLLICALVLANSLHCAYAYQLENKSPFKMICQKKVNEDIVSIRKIPSDSEIIEFSINPAGVVLGAGPLPEKITFKWLVKPGETNRSKTLVSLSKSQGGGPELNFTSPELQGEYSINIPKDAVEGKTSYMLTFSTEQYKRNVATVIFEVKSLQEVLEDIDVNGINFGDISNNIPEDTAFDLSVSINNHSNIDLPFMRLKVLLCRIGGPCEDNPLSYGEIPLVLYKGHRNYRIPLKFIPVSAPGWSSLKIKLLHSQTNILLRIWEFPIKSEEKRVYSIM
jgi:hypothetical protein